MVLFITELVNLTDKTIGFHEILDDGTSTGRRRRIPLEDLAPYETKNLVLVHLLMGDGLDYNIRLLMDGAPSNVKIRAHYFVACVRLVFTVEEQLGGLFVQGVDYDKSFLDALFRLRGIGHLLGRNKRWDKRPLEFIELEVEDEEGEFERLWNKNNLSLVN